MTDSDWLSVNEGLYNKDFTGKKILHELKKECLFPFIVYTNSDEKAVFWASHGSCIFQN